MLCRRYLAISWQFLLFRMPGESRVKSFEVGAISPPNILGGTRVPRVKTFGVERIIEKYMQRGGERRTKKFNRSRAPFIGTKF